MREDMADATFRRCRFLLMEACAKAKRDQATTFVMRVLSNLASVGMDAGPAKIKDLNRLISSGAATLLEDGISLEDWRKGTINEHPVPLKQTWEWLLKDAERLTEKDIWDHFVANQMVIVAKSEDAHLNRIGLRSAGGSSRYSQAGISIIKLSVSPREIIERRLPRHRWQVQ